MSVAENRPGILFMLIGPGGVGKNAILEKVLVQAEKLRQLPTATTRPMRPTEAQGREHLFVTPQEFRQMIQDNALIEHQEVHEGLYYGVPRTTVEHASHAGEDLIADIDVLGAKIIQEQYPKTTISVFIAPPSLEVVEKRLKGRDASEKDIEDRLARLPMEMRYAPLCDYVIINDNIETASHELLTIIRLARGEISLPIINFPKYPVSFEIRVIPMSEGEMLQPEDDTVLSQRLTGHENPDDAALRYIERHFGIAADLEALKPGLLENIDSVTCEYRDENSTYTFIYPYRYHLPADLTPPEGWHVKNTQHIGA